LKLRGRNSPLFLLVLAISALLFAIGAVLYLRLCSDVRGIFTRPLQVAGIVPDGYRGVFVIKQIKNSPKTQDSNGRVAFIVATNGIAQVPDISPFVDADQVHATTTSGRHIVDPNIPFARLSKGDLEISLFAMDANGDIYGHIREFGQGNEGKTRRSSTDLGGVIASKRQVDRNAAKRD